ncbi:MAG TPA: PAS domain-containing sensor histidine kinase [Caulobacteraceae bacterium]
MSPAPVWGGGPFGVGWGVAAALTGVAVYMASSAPGSGPIGPVNRTVLILLGLNLALILFLCASALRRLLGLVFQRARDAGARLHLRFVLLFAVVAVAPAIIVALVYGALVTRAVDNWFSHRVQTVVENSAKVAKAYYEDQLTYLDTHVRPMAGDVNDAAPNLKAAPIRFSQFLEQQAIFHAFPAVYLIDSQGRILARFEAPGAPPFAAPPPAAYRTAQRKIDAQRYEIDAQQFENQDLLRALYRLSAYPDAYLYVARFVHPGILTQLHQASDAVTNYRDADRARRAIQTSFALSYLETTLLVLVGAVWLGMSAASSIAAPVARLVHAADRVAGGDLDARVEIHNDPEEIAVLSRAFNRMTEDLQDQQEALKRANADAESRRQFIETVLAEVSAGVIGLDGEGRVSAANRRALALLGLEGGEPHGRRLAEVAPELAQVVDRAAAHRAPDAGEEIDIVRSGDTRRLRVRASGETGEGLVLTFDDITRLVAAQRNAAWRDVARRIAHEIKNPLTPIQLSAERLRRKYRKELVGDLETFDRCTDTIIRQVEDIGRMVDEFSAFARMPAPRFEDSDATELLRRAVFAQRVASPDITVELVEPVQDAVILADTRMVGQALTNILKNASEAVSARKAAEPGLGGRLRARLISDDEQVAFEIEDNGVGLPAKDRDRLTEPYVTTREKGTGLGLAIVKRIMEEHGGMLVMQDASELPGAKVVLRFPPQRKPEEAASPAGVAVLSKNLG